MDYLSFFDLAREELARIDHELKKLDNMGYEHPEELDNAACALITICGYLARRIDPKILVVEYVRLKDKTREAVRKAIREAIEFSAIFRDPVEVSEWNALMGES